MDFAQALLCLVTFGSPSTEAVDSNSKSCVQEESKVEIQQLRGRFDLDFHRRPVDDLKGQSIMIATMPHQ
jgi:hypothetical protein